MKSKILYIAWLAASTGVLAGCGSDRSTGRAVSVTPAPCVLTPDDGMRAELDVVFHVPEDYVAKRSRLVITPRLVVGDSVKDEYLPLVVDGSVYKKKLRRREVLENYVDTLSGRIRKIENASSSFDLPYRESVHLPEGIDEARVVAVVSTDGCGACTGIDTIDVASVARQSLDVRWREPVFTVRPKVVDGKGEARLQFAINQHDIDLSLGNNRKELEAMLTTLAPVLTDTLATVRTFIITGMASADGPLAFNTRLAERRAQAAKEWVAQRLGLSRVQKARITTDSRPEGWRPVLDAMTKAGDADSLQVKDVLVRYAGQNDDVQEHYIRRLGCWNTIRDRYLSKDRKVEYAYSYTIRSFTTDAELLSMYSRRPDAFNEQELLKVSTLMTTDEEKIAVYRTVLKYFPRSETATNNLAWLYLRQGREEEARTLLRTLPELYPGIDGKRLIAEDKR